MSEKKNFIELQNHRVFMGLGDAVLRLIHVEFMYANNTDPEDQVIAERKLIVQALNQQYQLDLGLDCDRDGIPDSIEAFSEAAATNCCRILPEEDTSRKKSEDFPSPRKRGSSRKQEENNKDPKIDNSKGFFGSIFGSSNKEK